MKDLDFFWGNIWGRTVFWSFLNLFDFFGGFQTFKEKLKFWKEANLSNRLRKHWKGEGIQIATVVLWCFMMFYVVIAKVCGKTTWQNHQHVNPSTRGSRLNVSSFRLIGSKWCPELTEMGEPTAKEIGTQNSGWKHRTVHLSYGFSWNIYRISWWYLWNMEYLWNIYRIIMTGLVVDETPLKSMSSSIGMMTFPIYVEQQMFQTTNQTIFMEKSSLVGGFNLPYPFWKIWVRQLAWWHSQYMNK